MKFFQRIWDWIIQKPHYTEEELLFGPVGPSSYHTSFLRLDMNHFEGMKERELVPKAPWPEGYDVKGPIIDKRDVFMHDAKWPKPRNGVLPEFCPTASFPLPEFTSRAAR